MISDTLFEASEELKDYLRDYPEVYAFIRPRIEALIAEMNAVQTILDTPPK